MQVPYPKSFRKLLFVGFSLVALPLLIALVNNAVSIDRLADKSRHAVYGAVQATESSRALAESITNEERVARQYLVLGDPALLEGLASAHEQFLKAARALAQLPLSARQREQLDDILARESAIYFETITQNPRTAPEGVRAEKTEAMAGEFANLAKEGRAILATSNEVIAREVAALQELAGRAQNIVLWQLLALVPAAVILVVGFSLVLARPVRQLDEGIRKLGNADFESPIAVSGPQDLEYLGRQLDWLRQRLAVVEEQKSRFLRHVSHELKTPLTALREGSELLADESAGPLTSEQREVVGILRNNSIELRKLIENLLNYSAVQFQKGTLSTKPIKMRDVIKRVAADQKLAMIAKDLKLKLICPDFVLQADEEKLRVTLDNLLSNAIRFSPRGGIVSIIARRNGVDAVVEVMDQGPGIDGEDRGRIFDPFYQGRQTAAAPVSGTGLGLSIAREHVLSHGGTIEVVDEKGVGAHFRVTMPLVQQELAA